MLANIKVERKRLAVTKGLAYFKKLITDLKNLIV
jgi:hypothetical protein